MTEETSVRPSLRLAAGGLVVCLGLAALLVLGLLLSGVVFRGPGGHLVWKPALVLVVVFVGLLSWIRLFAEAAWRGKVRALDGGDESGNAEPPA